jgi:hypothetical protein
MRIRLIQKSTYIHVHTFHHGRTRDCRSARVESSVCWIYGWTRRLTVPAGVCTHACIAARLRVIPWKLACTACCTARLYNLVWTSFALGLWPKAELGSTHGIGLGVFYSVQNGTLIRPASTRFVIDCSRTPVPRNRFVQVGVSEEAGSGVRLIWS